MTYLVAKCTLAVCTAHAHAASSCFSHSTGRNVSLKPTKTGSMSEVAAGLCISKRERAALLATCTRSVYAYKTTSCKRLTVLDTGDTNYLLMLIAVTLIAFMARKHRVKATRCQHGSSPPCLQEGFAADIAGQARQGDQVHVPWLTCAKCLLSAANRATVAGNIAQHSK